MSYTIDAYRGHMAPTRNLLDFALYVAYFPQLVAGPIERATHLLKQIAAPRIVTRPMIESGCFLILLGLFRKVAIADGVAPLVNGIFAKPEYFSRLKLCLGAARHAIQIYCDFAGFSDIARGTSRLIGIDLMVNIRQPYFSRNITEFWRQWHISLSSWLRDYLYIPRGGNRRGTAATYRNLLFTMLLGGLWHGARWNFVIRGGLHGAYLAAHKLWLARGGGRSDTAPGTRIAPGNIAGIAGTSLLVALAWIFFRCPSLAAAIGFLQGIFAFRGGWEHLPWGLRGTTLAYAGLPLFTDLPDHAGHRQERMLDWPWGARSAIYAAMLFLLILLRPLDDTPFIYFQF